MANRLVMLSIEGPFTLFLLQFWLLKTSLLPTQPRIQRHRRLLTRGRSGRCVKLNHSS